MASRSIEIPEETYAALESELEHLGFDSVDRLVAHALELLVSTRAADGPTEGNLTEGEEAEMKRRLADLGYM